MVFSENRYHFPESALADVAIMRARVAQTPATDRALWPQPADRVRAYGTSAHLRTGTFAVDERRG